MEDRCGVEGENRLGGATRASDVADLVQRYQVQPNQFYVRKQQHQEQALRAFDAGYGMSANSEREIERLRPHAKIGQLIVERDFSIGEVRKMSVPDRRALLDSQSARKGTPHRCSRGTPE